MSNKQAEAVKKDGGFYFPAWGIHVVAGTVDEARALVRELHGKDVDKDTPPPADLVRSGEARNAPPKPRKSKK